MSTTMNIKDVDWIRQSFILPRNAVSNMGAKRMVNSDAALKFTDTTLGGAFAINPLPQFNEFTDIPVENKWATGTAMGGYYSEAYDDNQRYIHMRFGVPEFNSTLLPRVDFTANNFAPSSIARRASISEILSTDVMKNILEESYKSQGFTAGAIDGKTLNSERVWQDQGAPQWGEGPNVK